MNKTLIIIILSLLLGATGFVAIKSYIHPREDDGMLLLQEIKRIKELHLVSYRYEDVFFYHNRQDKGKKVIVMSTVPVTVSAYFDMGGVELERKDSVIHVSLPPVKLSEPNYQIDKMKVKTVRRFSVMAGIDLHQRMLEALSQKIIVRKAGVLSMAKENGIEQIAAQQAQHYLTSFFGTLGFKRVNITFKDTDTDIDQKELEPEMIPLDGVKILD